MINFELKSKLYVDFVFAGKAILTIVNTKTRKRFTFKVKKFKDKDNLWFVYVLSGSDNTKDYSFIGSVRYISIFNSFKYKYSKKSRINNSSQSIKVFDWFLITLNANKLPEYIKLYHIGRCGRCNRELTVPKSIEQGFGPKCINPL